MIRNAVVSRAYKNGPLVFVAHGTWMSLLSAYPLSLEWGRKYHLLQVSEELGGSSNPSKTSLPYVTMVDTMCSNDPYAARGASLFPVLRELV